MHCSCIKRWAPLTCAAVCKHVVMLAACCGQVVSKHDHFQGMHCTSECASQACPSSLPACSAPSFSQNLTSLLLPCPRLW